ncbi:MAG: sensor histidine kinase [Prochlorotrichaceae cyanobacterium]
MGLGLCLLYRWQWLDRFAHSQGRRLLPSLSWKRMWTLEIQLLQKLQEQQTGYDRVSRQLEDMRQLLESLPLAYLQVDVDNNLIWCNGATATVLRVPMPNTSEPRLLLELIRSYDLDRLIEVTRETGQLQEREWIVNSVNRDPANPVVQAPLYLRGRSLSLSEGGVGVFLEDRYDVITVHQQQNRWVSDVAHELKTPLTSIRLVAETLLNRVDSGLRSWMERLLNEVIHLSSLVQDLLDLSRFEQRIAPEGGFSPAQVEPALSLETIDMVELVYSAWETLFPLNRHKQTHLLYLGPDVLMLEGDSSRLYRVILNLLDNAIKYSPPDRDIEVSLSTIATAPENSDPTQVPNEVQEAVQKEIQEKVQETVTTDQADPSPEEWVILDVIDQGSGFPPQSLLHVFDRFYRADPARVREASSHLGTSSSLPYTSSCGLGLAIVKQIVNAHQGSVEAKNHPLTGGAWIRVHLPLKQRTRL